ncbi:MAG: hypothetical protein EOO52_15475 [Gammaproteobacteria bacterium]|nr:MAG: hypothetical protein EOO52_15475 [Gammaproteobacteria bacterium]
MNALIFSQSAIFRLQQLATHYYHHTGVRHKLANEDGILELLQFSSLETNRNVRNAYDAFVNELNKRQIDALTKKGVSLRLPLQAAASISQVMRG